MVLPWTGEELITRVDRYDPLPFGYRRQRGFVLRSERAVIAGARLGDREVVLKVGHGGSSAILDSFEREIRALACIDHPNVVPLLDWGRGRVQSVESQRPFFPYVVLPRFDRNLWSYGRDRRLGASHVVCILSRLASGIRAIHRAGFVHCDLRPDNVLVGARSGRYSEVPPIAIADFGECRPAHGGPYLLRHRMNLYRPLDEELTPAVDWYAFGVIAFGLSYRREFDPSALAAGAPTVPAGTGEIGVVDDAIRQLTDRNPSRRVAAATSPEGVVSELMAVAEQTCPGEDH